MVAELLFSQQIRKLWIMSLAVLGKQMQRSSQSPRPKAGSDVCLVWAVVLGAVGWGKVGGSQGLGIGAGERLEVFIEAPRGTAAALGSASGLRLPLPSPISSKSSRPKQVTAALGSLREPLYPLIQGSLEAPVITKDRGRWYQELDSAQPPRQGKMIPFSR